MPGSAVGIATHPRAVLVAEGVSKSFGRTQALSGVTLAIEEGVIHGLVGANGAGKTTLMRILAGELHPTSGGLSIDGRTVSFAEYSPRQAAAYGIRLVHQELPLFGNLAVFEHFAVDVARPDRHDRAWRRRAMAQAQRALDAIFPGAGVRPRDSVGRLSLAQRQMVEIARAATSPGLRVLILDEPTSALPREYVDTLKAHMRTLATRGVSILLVSHRLQEILSLTTSVTVLRDGATMWTGRTTELTEGALIDLMGGQPGHGESAGTEQTRRPAADQILAVDHLQRGRLRDVSLAVAAGEIVGLAGLEGSGQRELLQAVYFAGARDRAIRIRGRRAFVSGDRREEGIFPLWSVARNLVFSSLAGLRRCGLIAPRLEVAMFGEWRRRLQVQVAGAESPITALSGGNQQKVLIARAMAARPRLLLLDDPTRGVDAATKSDLYRILRSFAHQGGGVLWYSTEEEEMAQCDRVYVLNGGAVVDEMPGAQAQPGRLVAAAFKVKPGEAPSEAPALLRRRKAILAALQDSRWILAAVALLIIVAIIGLTSPSALAISGIPILVSSFLPLVFASLAAMFIIQVSDIDIGLGAFVGLVNVIAATWLATNPGLGVLALLGCMVLYSSQALLVELRRLPSIIVTLGASFVWLGIALTIQPTPGGVSPDWLTNASNLNIPLVPEPILVSAVCAAVASVFLTRTRLGIQIRALGNNRDALAASGYSPLALRLVAYAIAGAFAIGAGLAQTALTSAADANAAQPYTLLGIAGVVLGGGLFAGGRVYPAGAVIGAWVLSLIESLLGLLALDTNLALILEGTALIVVLGIHLIIDLLAGAV